VVIILEGALRTTVLLYHLRHKGDVTVALLPLPQRGVEGIFLLLSQLLHALAQYLNLDYVVRALVYLSLCR